MSDQSIDNISALVNVQAEALLALRPPSSRSISERRPHVSEAQGSVHNTGHE